ncbi:MAG: DUF1592 domain-containing protein [Bdellovibrionales bacterium]
MVKLNLKVGFAGLLGLALLNAGCSGYKSASLSSKSGGADPFPIPTSASRKVCQTAPAIGRTTVQRLNRAEYNNTLRDLLGIQSRPADDFPADPAGETFNTNADVLNLTTSQLDMYIAAAEAAVNEAFTLNRTRFIICAQTTTACATQILTAFAEKAFRRPVTSEEVSRLAALVAVAQGQNESFEVGIKLAMRAALVAPDFLFRTIRNPAPNSPTSIVNLDAYELASRVSYFIWSSMPDDSLFAAAKDGSLLQPATLQAQVKRMLKDTKSQGLIDTFAMQWLGLNNIGSAQPNPTKFPEYNATLRDDMVMETKMLIQDMIATDANPSHLLKANYSFMNSRLALLYGISGVTGTQFRRVSLAGTNRQGVLGHAGLLTLTSHTDEPSIVFRGKLVIKNLMCDPPPPPPPNIPTLPGSELQQSQGRLADNRCMGCHRRMDPIGYALQTFDGLGKPRTVDENGLSIDDRGQLYTGEPFKGPIELSNVVAADQRFGSCISKKLLAFALARDLSTQDDCAVSQVAAFSDDNKSFSELIYGVVSNQVFRKQAGDGGTP